MTVANARTERDAAISKLAGLSRSALLHELVTWTVTAHAIAEESRELRRRRAEARTMLELIAGEVTGRQDGERPRELHPTEVAS